MGGSLASHVFHPHRIPLAPDASHPPPVRPPPPGLPSSPALLPQTPLCRPDFNKTCFSLLTAFGGCQSLCAEARAPPWPRQGAPPPLGKGRGRREWAGAGAGVAGTGAGSPGPHWLRPPPHEGSPHLPPTSVRPASSCCSRAFTVSASSRPLLRPGMATPTQAPTKGERRLGRGRAGWWGGSWILTLRGEDLGRFQY